jgi:hypothetical protein
MTADATGVGHARRWTSSTGSVQIAYSRACARIRANLNAGSLAQHRNAACGEKQQWSRCVATGMHGAEPLASDTQGDSTDTSQEQGRALRLHCPWTARAMPPTQTTLAQAAMLAMCDSRPSQRPTTRQPDMPAAHVRRQQHLHRLLLCCVPR